MDNQNRKAIRAIKTSYNGYKFRSRLEARWAVFYDALNIEYIYEPEGFILPDGTWYLPDFWLPRHEYWIEIKGKFTEVDDNKYNQFAECVPYGKPYLFFGDIPNPTPVAMSWSENIGTVMDNDWCLRSNSDSAIYYGDIQYHWCECPKCGKLGIEFNGRAARICGNKCFPGHDKLYNDASLRLIQAYDKARSARFEFGESG